MKPNTMSICNDCHHKNGCVLTSLKSKVWSCSEYSQEYEQSSEHITAKQELEQEMAMV